MSFIRPKSLRGMALIACAIPLSGCATVGSMMSPYSEKFSCKNSDHGQCIHPDKAYADAVSGVQSRSDPAVTRDQAMLRDQRGDPSSGPDNNRAGGSPYQGYRDSIYRELQGLIEDPVTPMLRPGRTVRTLILPYADRDRPDRLYMPRYVYSILERPQWVIGDYLVAPDTTAVTAPVLQQVQDKTSGDPAASGDPAPAPALPDEVRP
jgi:conjugal transfer pilus assembly protein TraV